MAEAVFVNQARFSTRALELIRRLLPIARSRHEGCWELNGSQPLILTLSRGGERDGFVISFRQVIRVQSAVALRKHALSRSEKRHRF